MALAEMPKSPRSAPNAVRVIEVLAYPAVQLLDVTGPLQVFASANDHVAASGGAPPYVLRVVAQGGQGVTASAGLALAAEPLPPVGDGTGYADGRRWPGRRGGGRGPGAGRLGAGASEARAPRRVRLHRRVPAGRFRRAGWATRGDPLVMYCAKLARRFPAVRVEPDPIFVRDGPVWTSAGVTAGIDLALALVEEDLGRTVALAVARYLVVFLKRPGRTGAIQRCVVAANGRRQIRRAA